MRTRGEALVKPLCIRPGLKVLDLACNDPSTALTAARLGAQVHALDIASGADLAALEDRSFDLVLSFFGAMYAPRPFEVARDLVRLTRPGGRIVMGNWMPEGPAPGPALAGPLSWGIEDNVVERFRAAGVAPQDIACVRMERYLRVKVRVR